MFFFTLTLTLGYIPLHFLIIYSIKSKMQASLALGLHATKTEIINNEKTVTAPSDDCINIKNVFEKFS
jgi:hypothetical protein